MTTNICILHVYDKTIHYPEPNVYKFIGVYSTKELADAKAIDYKDTWGDQWQHIVTIKALDDYIEGVTND